MSAQASTVGTYLNKNVFAEESREYWLVIAQVQAIDKSYWPKLRIMTIALRIRTEAQDLEYGLKHIILRANARPKLKNYQGWLSMEPRINLESWLVLVIILSMEPMEASEWKHFHGMTA